MFFECEEIGQFAETGFLPRWKPKIHEQLVRETLLLYLTQNKYITKILFSVW